MGTIVPGLQKKLAGPYQRIWPMTWDSGRCNLAKTVVLWPEVMDSFPVA